MASDETRPHCKREVGPQGTSDDRFWKARRVVASGGRYLEKDERDIPDTFMMMADYPSEHTIVLVSVMTNDVGVPDIIRGQYATMEFGAAVTVREQAAWMDEFRSINAGRFPHRLVRDDDGK